MGVFSKVYRFRKEKDKAAKKIMLDPMIYSAKLIIVNSVKSEVFGIFKCQFKHATKLNEVIQNHSENVFYLVMELCEGNLEY